MSGWTVHKLERDGYEVLYMSDDTGEETVAGVFGPESDPDELIDQVVSAGEVGDWIIGPEGEAMIIGSGGVD